MSNQVSTTALVTPDTTVDADDGPPDGGTRAWLVVLGGFLTYFVTFGLLNSFGTFQVYYGQELMPHEDESAISWIGSIQLFLLYVGGLAFGPIFDTKGSKVLFIPGTILFVLSLMMTSLCDKFYQFILAQSLLFGIGDAMLFYPTISAIPHWFSSRRGLAMGTVLAGSSLGGIAWPLIIKRLLDEVGFPWTLRIAGFISLVLLAPAIILVVPRLPPRKKSEKSAGLPKVDLIAGLKDLRYWLTVAGMLFVIWGMFIPFGYIPLLAIERGVDSTFAVSLVSILNAGSFVGRIATGAMADKLGKFNMAVGCALISTILLLCLHAINTKSTITAFTFLYGLTSGGLMTLQSACVAQITRNMQTIGFMIGVMMAVCSIGALTGTPISGRLNEKPLSGTAPAWVDFAGAMMFGGTVFLAAARISVDSRLYRAI
ncbi:MCT family MFS transporter [Aspergillus undulatus]|uniref:MCT family MFS transporter n=1 Tax=Aspergillus undulatus TaxID=1810928 RepID=UPI003CCDBC08